MLTAVFIVRLFLFRFGYNVSSVHVKVFYVGDVTYCAYDGHWYAYSFTSSETYCIYTLSYVACMYIYDVACRMS